MGLVILVTARRSLTNRYSFVPLVTARRYACTVYAIIVCLSVCVSVTLRYCIKMAKRRITQITPHDSPGTLVF